MSPKMDMDSGSQCRFGVKRGGGQAHTVHQETGNEARARASHGTERLGVGAREVAKG